jgi:flagellar biosynthetic protein FliR
MDFTQVARFGLLLVRPGMLFVVAPAFGGTWAPGMVKAGLTVMVAVILAGVVPLPGVVGPAGVGLVVARETVIGLSLAFGVRVLIGAAELAGYLAGFQIGFTYATVADPQTGARNNILSSVYGLLALVVFFASEGHHEFLRALAMSYELLPVGVGGIDGSIAALVARMLGLVFELGVQMAAPVLVTLLIAELGLGLMARAAPSFNLMAQGFPIRIAVGLAVLALTLRVIPLAIRGGIPSVLRIGTGLAEAFR